MPLVAGVVSSVQSTSIEVRDADTGAVVASATAEHPPVTGWSDGQDPEVWWHAFERCWSELGAPSVSALSVVAEHGVVVLDHDRRPVRPALVGSGSETEPDARWLRKQLPDGESSWVDAIGSAPTAGHTIAVLSWLHRSEPDTWGRLAHVVAPRDLFGLRLTGQLVTDPAAAAATGYWTPDAGYRWDLLSIVDRERDWTTVMPRVAAPGEVIGEWSGAPVVIGAAAGTDT